MSTTINFGKHKGKTIEQLKTEDINWLIWMTKNYNVYSFSSPNPYARLKDSTIRERQALLNAAKEAVAEHFDLLAETNRKSSSSEYVGNLREKFHRTLTVIGVYERYGYTLIKAETVDKNIIHFYDKGFGLAAGQEIEVKGIINKHAEKAGIQVTYINRVKVNINEQN